MLELFLFGPPRCQQDGQDIHLPRRKNLALLAFLALSPGPQSRESLATLLHPDAEHAAKYLRRNLSELRKTLGNNILKTAESNIRINPDRLWTDAVQFQTLAQPPIKSQPIANLQAAVSLYTNDFLSGFTLPNAPAFDQWQHHQAENLSQLFSAVLQTLLTYHAARHEFERAIQYGRRRLQLDPLHEPAQRDLIRLYAAAGQKSAALRQFEESATLLQAELGVEPEAATASLVNEIQSAPDDANFQAYFKPRAGLINFPLETTPFFGRLQEITDLEERLKNNPNCRLLTILGSGGMGKTRLALEAGRRFQPAFTHGVCFVSLASISKSEELAPAITAALDLQSTARQSPRDQLLRFLKDHNLLLILDNFEHLIPTVNLISDILRTAPRVKLLITSRERLNITPEWTYDLTGLTYPGQPGPAVPIADLLNTYSAPALFVQRSRQLRTAFTPTRDNWSAILDICRLVEGLPLALELAASWIPVMSCPEIAEAIGRNLDFLSTTLHDIPDRHRSLRAVFEHSWSLLTVEEQNVLTQLAIFHGGYTRKAAEQVTASTILPIAGLVRKSLVARTSDGRYTLHELLRQFAGERLSASARDQAQENHLSYYMDLSEETELKLNGPEQIVWFERLQNDYDNLQAALKYAMTSGHIEIGLRLACALRYFWMVKGHVSEGRKILDNLIALSEADPKIPSKLTARARIEAATLANAQGDKIRAERWYADGLQSFQQLGDKRGIALALNGLGNVSWMKGDFSQARPFQHQSWQYFQELGDESGMARTLNMLGLISLEEGEPDKAFAYLDQSLALRQKTGDLRGMAVAFNNLGNVPKNPTKKAFYYRESLNLYRSLLDMANTAEPLEGLAGVAQRCNHLEPAARLLGAVFAFRSLVGTAQSFQDQIDNQALVSTIRAQLNESEFQSAWKTGQAMTLVQAIEFGLQVSDKIVESRQ